MFFFNSIPLLSRTQSVKKEFVSVATQTETRSYITQPIAPITSVLNVDVRLQGSSSNSQQNATVIINDNHNISPHVAPFTASTSAVSEPVLTTEPPIRTANNQSRKYCPYEGCDVSRTYRGRLYPHIRRVHDTAFPSLTSVPHKFLIPSGIRIEFNENDRNSLAAGERIRVLRLSYEELRAHCPYRNCGYACNCNHIYRHLHKRHNKRLPSRSGRNNVKYMLRRVDSEQPLDLMNESVINSVGGNDEVVVELVSRTT
ncbi:hypothetical protein BJV82DRAFT_628364 [Fennellomyces sp. T-0311]|nr:hypothetical protein BJV82DRAFT_628364 [Fennellomyces sp. T-0311]